MIERTHRMPAALPPGFKLSVVIPVYNERPWVRELLRRVDAVPIPKEIIIVDDASTDGTRDLLRELDDGKNLRVLYLPNNQGKGAAFAQVSAMPRETSSWFRMPTWSTTRPSTPV